MLALLAVSRAARRALAPSALASWQDFFFESACGSPHSVPCGHSPTCSREYRACAPCASGEQSFQAAAEEDDEDEDEDGEHLLKLQLLDTALEHVVRTHKRHAAILSTALHSAPKLLCMECRAKMAGHLRPCSLQPGR